MKIAVLMSTYNGGLYLEEQIDSILNQKGNFEVDIYVRDDGSSDHTIDILTKYERKKKLSWYQGKNLKSARSFIDLVRKYDGYDYYAFADQDDYWMSDKLQCAIDKLSKINKPAIYCANAEIVDRDLMPLNRNVYRKDISLDMYTITCNSNILGCTMVFNELLAKVIRNSEEPSVVMMHDSFIARVCVAIGGVILFDEKSHMKYRQHSNNVIGVKAGNIDKIKQRIYEITHKSKISIVEQSREIIRLYKDEILDENMQWLIKIVHYRDNIFNKFSLAFTKKTRYSSKNISFQIRMKILLGNR